MNGLKLAQLLGQPCNFHAPARRRPWQVCLSLLGTWSGPGWVPGQSTLLQVLVSIQSMLLVPDPHSAGLALSRGAA